MAKLRLLERLSEARRTDERAHLAAADHLLQSICAYVTKLLNTRRGSTLLDPEFGVPDFTNAGAGFSKDDIPYLQQTVAAFITRYEPRLIDVRVMFAPVPEAHTVLTFAISARIRDEDANGIPVLLYSNMTQEGKIDVRL
ncbi:MAG: type VI secretion system baseplate subunit TssE [Desulfovibrio sp.]|jgi:type VI secretion system protein|nr:type VI secretion system baseplate subunit TssE [Desulfovibrio sp.]